MSERSARSEDGPTSGDLLRSMTEESVEDQLRAAVDRAEDLVARLDEDQAQTPLTPEELAAIDEVTGGPDAPLAFRSLRARVESGVISWDDVWREPERHGPEGVRLVFAVLAHSARSTPSMDELVAAADELGTRPGRPDTGLGAGRRDDAPPSGPVLGR